MKECLPPEDYKKRAEEAAKKKFEANQPEISSTPVQVSSIEQSGSPTSSQSNSYSRKKSSSGSEGLGGWGCLFVVGGMGALVFSLEKPIWCIAAIIVGIILNVIDNSGRG